MEKFLMQPRDVIIAWQFPTSHKGEQKSELVTGRRVTHRAVGGQLFYIHFKCKSADEARKHKKWRVQQGHVGDESVHVILRPAHTVAPTNANAFEVKDGKAIPVMMVLQDHSPKRQAIAAEIRV